MKNRWMASGVAAAFALLLVPDTVYYPPRSVLNQPSVLLQGLAAYWKLNELSGTRMKTAGYCTNCTLTAVNAPLAMAGAGGYSLQTVNAQEVSVANNSSLQAPAGTDFAVCIWTMYVTSTANTRYLFRQAGSYSLVSNVGSGTLDFGLVDSVAGTSTASGSGADGFSAIQNKRALVCGWYTASDKKAHLSVNAGTVYDGAALPNGPAVVTNTHQIGYGAALNSTYTFGPAYRWNGSIPNITTLYNGGSGYSCSQLPAALRTNLAACWNLDEASGTRYTNGGSCGSTCDMSTVVNAPGRVVGLAQNGMGMSGNFVAASNQALTLASAGALTRQPNWAVAVWYNAGDVTARSIMGKDDGVTREWSISSNNGPCTANVWNNAGTIKQATSGAASINTWNLCVAWLDGTDDKLRASVNDTTAGVSTALTAPYTDQKSVQFQISGNGAATNMYQGAIDAAGVWTRVLLPAERTALYAAGAGVGDPWTQVSEMFQRPVLWADIPIERRQKLVWLKTGVVVPPDMFPSRKVVVLR